MSQWHSRLNKFHPFYDHVSLYIFFFFFFITFDFQSNIFNLKNDKYICKYLDIYLSSYRFVSGFGSFGLFKWISRCVSFLNEVLDNLQPLLFCPLNLVSSLLKLVWFWFLLVAFKDFQRLCECCEKLFVIFLASIYIFFHSFRLWCLFVIL